MTTESPSWTRRWLGSLRGQILLVFLAIAAFFLFTEHRAHVFGVLPYVLLLLCPVLHLLMHYGHKSTPPDHEAKPQRRPPGGA